MIFKFNQAMNGFVWYLDGRKPERSNMSNVLIAMYI